MPDVLEKYSDCQSVRICSIDFKSGDISLTTKPGHLDVRPSSFIVNVENVDIVFLLL